MGSLKLRNLWTTHFQLLHCIVAVFWRNSSANYRKSKISNATLLNAFCFFDFSMKRSKFLQKTATKPNYINRIEEIRQKFFLPSITITFTQRKNLSKIKKISQIFSFFTIKIRRSKNAFFSKRLSKDKTQSVNFSSINIEGHLDAHSNIKFH